CHARRASADHRLLRARPRHPRQAARRDQAGAQPERDPAHHVGGGGPRAHRVRLHLVLRRRPARRAAGHLGLRPGGHRRADGGDAAVRHGGRDIHPGAGQGAGAAAGHPAALDHPRGDRVDHRGRRHLARPRDRTGGWHSRWVTQRKHDSASPGGDRIREDTTRRLERAMGSLGTAAMARMDERLPWFRALSAEDRSWVGLVAQAGIAAFVEWVQHADEEGRPTPNIEFFGTAPRELKRSISLQQTVDIVRVVVEVVDERVDELAAPGGEAQLEHAVLRYTRDVAFAAAQVYAREAEVRGAWDARLEALIVDALVRGQVDDGLHSWAAALGWTSSPVVVLAGRAPDDKPEAVIDRLRDKGRRSGIDVLAGVQGDRLIVIVGGVDSASAATRQLLSRFGPGPVVIGPEVPDLQDR